MTAAPLLASFPTPRAVLAFIDSLGDCGAVRCHAAPDGSWWVLAAVDPDQNAELAFAYGGSVEGDPSRLGAWPAVLPARLAAEHPAPAEPPGRLRVVHVLTGGPIAHRVLLRCLATGANVSFHPVSHRPLSGRNPTAALRIRVSALADTGLPVRTLAGLDALPGTRLFRPCDPAQRLLVDLRHRLLLPEAVVAEAVPETETWLVGGPGFGVRALFAPADYQDATVLLAPASRTAPPPTTAPPSSLQPVAVRVVPDDRAPLRTDARLLTDAQLALLRGYLTYRRVAEDGLLLLGPGHHLLVEPAGLVQNVPFGRRMRKPGAAALFVEAGCELSPPLPPSAHRSVFGLDDGRTVAVWRTGSAAFRPEHGIPVWTQWLTEPPDVRAGLSQAAMNLLAGLEALGRPTLPPAAEPAPEPQPAEAARLELQGRFAEAARILQDAGQWLKAAHLWQLAAEHELAEPGPGLGPGPGAWPR